MRIYKGFVSNQVCRISAWKWTLLLPTDVKPRDRHPWLAALLKAPERECARLLDGTADVGAYSRADPAQIVSMLAGDLEAADPIVRAFDRGIAAWLEVARKERPERPRARQVLAQKALDAFRSISVVSGPRIVQDFWRNFVRWYRWSETAGDIPQIDLRAEFLTMLAKTQNRLDPAEADRIPMWLSICGRAGRALPNSYLEIGLLGLRRANRPPLADQPQSGLSNEEYCIVGLVNWAAHKPFRQVKDELAEQWSALKLSYPHLDGFWKEAFDSLVAPRRQELDDRIASQWAGAVQLRGAGEGIFHGRLSQDETPATEEPFAPADIAGGDWGRAKAGIYNEIGALVRRVRKGGDTHPLAVRVTQLGNAALDHGRATGTEAASVALELAMVGLTWEPQNAYCWSLWRDALAAAGNERQAEIVGVEGARRFPENAAMWTGLATIWIRQARRTKNPNHRAGLLERSESVLRDTWRRTGNVYAFNMTAMCLNQLNRHEEAEAMLRESIESITEMAWKDKFRHGWDLRNVIVARNLLAQVILRDPSMTTFKEAEALARESLQLEYSRFSESILIRALVGINQEKELTEARRLLKHRNDEHSKALLYLLDERTKQGGVAVPQHEGSARSDQVAAIIEEALAAAELEQSSAPDRPIPEQAREAAGQSKKPNAAERPSPRMPDESRAPEQVVADRMVSLASDAAIRIDTRGPRKGRPVKQEAAAPHRPEPIGSLDPDFQKKSERNLRSLDYYASVFASAIGLSDEDAPIADWDDFGNFLLMGLQPWNEGAENFCPLSSAFGSVLMAAIRRKDPAMIEELEASFPQEEIVCRLAIAQLKGARDDVKKILAAAKAKGGWRSLGPASRAIMGMINSRTLDDFMNDNDPIMTLALASTFEVPLVA